MYARVVVEGEVCAGDPIRCRRPRTNRPPTVFHRARAPRRRRSRALARDCGAPRRRPATTSGSSTTATCRPSPRRTLPGTEFNRAFGLRLVPIATDRGPRPLSRTPGPRAGSSTPARNRALPVPWRMVASASTPPPIQRLLAAAAPRRRRDWSSGRSDRARRTSERWVETYIAAFDVEPPIAEAWRAFEPLVARAHGDHQVAGRARRSRRGRRRDADPPSRRLARRRRRAPGGPRPRHPAGADRASGARGGDGRLHAGHVHGQRRVGVRGESRGDGTATRSGGGGT